MNMSAKKTLCISPISTEIQADTKSQGIYEKLTIVERVTRTWNVYATLSTLLNPAN